MQRKAWLFCALVAVLLACYSFRVNVIDEVPSVEFITLDGAVFAMPSLRGKTVLISFWATSCNICRAEIPALMALYKELKPKGLEIIGVAMPYDPPNRVLKYAKQIKIPYPISLDVEGKITRAFGDISVTPTLVLVDAQGKIRSQSSGYTDMNALKMKIEALLPKQLTSDKSHLLEDNLIAQQR